jgi:predicted metal-dependent peptidase
MLSPAEKITRAVEGWFLMEPLFFAVWTAHRLVETTAIDTIRVGRGRIEYNPHFLAGLDRQTVGEVLLFEVVRIVLRHPYQRRQDDARRAYLASNIAVQELLHSRLPMPTAFAVFGDHALDGKHYEFYYDHLQEVPGCCLSGQAGEGHCAGDSAEGECGGSGEQTSEKQGKVPGLGAYTDADHTGVQNAEGWDRDELFDATVTEVVRRIQESNSWGTVGGRLRERILATLRPRLNYRDVLRQFRTSILSIHRRLTRMKPNRRYGFLQMGSRYEYTTKLLFAVDVSGSMGSDDLQRGFSVVNRFFRFGVPTIDVVQFDTEIKGKPLTLRKARYEVEALGRGGTNFQPIIDYLDEHGDYDGLVIFTDGIAPVPRPPRNRHTRVLWLFKSEEAHAQMAGSLSALGRSAYLQDS